MYQTIIQFTQYPYNLNISQTQQYTNQSLKLQKLIQSQNSTQFIKNKQKYQYIKQKCIKNNIFVKLLQIFQQSLTIHLIYQYIPISIKEYVKYQISVYSDQYRSKNKDIHDDIKQNQYCNSYNYINHNNQNNQSNHYNNNDDNNNINNHYDNQYNIGLFQFKKQLLQYLYKQLILLTQWLINCSIITNLEYNNIGIYKDQNKCTNFQIISSQQSPFCFISTPIPQQSSSTIKQLTQFYHSQRKKILLKLQQDLQLQKRNDGLPLYIIKSNKIIFTDQLSQTKTRKRRIQSPQRKSHLGQQEFNKYKNKYNTFDRQSQRNPKKYPSWNTNIRDSNKNKMNDKFTKQKYAKSRPTSKSRKHKYSCNIQQQSLNLQFDNDDNNYNNNYNTTNNKQQDSQLYSITKTKSMKIQVQHQKPTKKNRKNSLKFKITTFQQIQIDQSVDQQGNQSYPENHQYKFPKYRHNDTDANNNMSNNNMSNNNMSNNNMGNSNMDNSNNMKDNMDDNQQDKKDYKQKVKQAKQKAQVLLAKYMKAKNKSTFK